MGTSIPLSMEALDFRYLLLEYYKKLGIKEDALTVILMIDHLTKQNNTFITADTLSLKMNYKVEEIDSIIADLVKRGLLSYELSGKEMVSSLEPLRKKIYKVFQIAVAKDKQNLASEERSALLQQLYGYFEKRLKRTLSPIENDMLSTWLDDGYSMDEIESALEESIATGRKTFKAIDRNLRTYRRRNDIDGEGYSGVDDNWSQDVAKTIEIANTKWLDDDGDE